MIAFQFILSGLLLFTQLNCFHSVRRNQTSAKSPAQDSVTVAEYRHPVFINTKQTILTIPLTTLQPASPPGSSFYLALDSMELTKTPEGVYEIYLSTNKATVSPPEAGSSSFVNVIDTYTLAVNKTAGSVTSM